MPLLLLLPIFHFALVFAYQNAPPSARHKLSRGTLHWFLHIKVPIPFVVFCCKNRLFILHWFLHIKVLPGCETPTRLVALCYVFCISKCASGFFSFAASLEKGETLPMFFKSGGENSDGVSLFGFLFEGRCRQV